MHFLSLALLSLAHFATAQLSPPAVPPGFELTSVKWTGVGCPSDTPSVKAGLNEAKTGISIVYNQFSVQTGPGIPATLARKNCHLTFGFLVPSGFSFGLTSVEYGGFYQLDSKVVGTQQSVYYFSGNPVQGIVRSDLNGPVAGAYYTYKDQFDFGFPVESACDSTTREVFLNVVTDLRVSNSRNVSGSGYVAGHESNNDLTQGLNTYWRKC